MTNARYMEQRFQKPACEGPEMISTKQGTNATAVSPSRLTPSRAAAAIGGVAVFWAGVAAALALLLAPSDAAAVVTGIAGFWGGVVAAGATFMVFAAVRQVNASKLGLALDSYLPTG